MNERGQPQAGAHDARRRPWADLGPRLISALVLIPATATAVYFGGYALAIVTGAAFAGAYYEWEAMISGRKGAWPGPLFMALLVLAGAAYPWGGGMATATVLLLGIGAAALVGGERWRWRIAGIAYFGAATFAVLSIRGETTTGMLAAVYLGLVIWMTDSAAFFAGRQMGGAKLSPDISPGKTWSGAFGGLALGAGSGVAYWLIATDSPWWIGLVLSVAGSVAGQLGDLAESAVKRHFRIKDSGDIIPGHGGFMDRLDSLVAGALLMLLVGVLHSGFGRVGEGILVW
ncbi:MAG TPA: phosphatidate cytidylyltransferase [Devosiaceae bacterium]